MAPRSTLACLASAIIWALATEAIAQAATYSPTGQPSSYELTGRPASVIGFRSARFGMTEAEVRAAISRDFGVPPGKPITTTDRTTGRQILLLRLSSIEPGPGLATLAYVLEAKSSRLTAVNITWSEATGEEPRLISAAAMLAADFLGRTWKPFTTARGIPVGPRSLIVFAGGDEQGAGVELRLDGVPYARSGKVGASAENKTAPGGAATLRVVYADHVPQPDIATITQARAPRPPGATTRSSNP